MISEFRPSSPADADDIAALCRRALAVPPGSPMFAAGHMQWKYWQSWPHWPGSRGFVLRRDGRLLAHGAVIPLRFAQGGRQHVLLYLFDWASEPDVVGSGVALFKRIAALADGMLLAGGSAMTRRMVRPLGFREIGEVTSHASPARPDPPIESEDEDEDRDHVVARLDLAAGHAIATLARPPSTRARILFERPTDALREIVRCPVAEMQYHEVTRRGVAVGCFLLAFMAGQGTIVDLFSPSARLDDWTSLLRLAHREASAHPDVAEVVSMAGDPLEREALARAGFTITRTDPLFVLAGDDLVPDGARVHFQMLDSDLAFLHHGAARRWLGETAGPGTGS